MRRPIPRLIAVTVVFLAFAAPWLFFPGQQSTAFAFNDFATALVEAKTAKFEMEVTIDGRPSQKAKGYYLAPAKYRLEMTGMMNMISVSDDLTGNMVMLTPAAKMAMVGTSKGRPKDQPPNDPFFRVKELLSKSRDSKENPFKPIGDKEINGKKAIGFRSDTGMGQFTLWGDPETGLPVRVEATMSGTPRNEVIMSDFEINADLDKSLFDMTPPADYKVMTIEIDVSKPGEQDLIKAFKTWAEISGGEFANSLDFLATIPLMAKHSMKLTKDPKNPTIEEQQQVQKEIAPINRGFRFAMELPESADAHYAGKGVKQGTADTPIFWYKPDGSTKYRVISADLTIKDAESAPQIAGAKRLMKAK
jgi:outer membrane lipoprotein-sorting protein